MNKPSLCETCGGVFSGCGRPNPSHKWRWRDHFCSKECADKYFASLDEADKSEKTSESTNKKSSKKNSKVEKTEE